MFPAWFIGRNPDWQIIWSTYNQKRGDDVGRKVRNLVDSDLHREIFPGCAISSDSKSVSHFSTIQGGEYFNISVGGGATGRGANCLPAETMLNVKIDSSIKTVDIATLVELLSSKEIKILSLDHTSNTLVYKKIIAARKEITNELYKITTNSGNYIRATGEHKFFIQGQGYIKTKDIQKGDTITIITDKKIPSMSGVWKKKNYRLSSLQILLSYASKSRYKNNMCMVRKRSSKKELRSTCSNKKKAQRYVLFNRMFPKTSRCKKQKKMCNLRKNNRNAYTKILFQQMQKRVQRAKENAKNNMSSMWENIFPIKLLNAALLPRMCQSNTFSENAWNTEFQLSAWERIQHHITQNAPFNTREGQQSMRCMQYSNGESIDGRWQYREQNKEGNSLTTSHRWGQDQQCTRKSNNTMSQLSYNSSQIKEDTISQIERISTDPIPVYDIQVEGTSNFFAHAVHNKRTITNDNYLILTHNCFIIDDPIKSRKEIESQTIRKDLHEWYRAVAYTRLMPDNRIIMINTRWHENDLSGYVLKEHPQEDWTILDLKAIAEENDILGREVGDALWPEAYPQSSLNAIEKIIGSYEWNAQYQQHPVSREGGMVKHAWLKRYSILPKLNRIIISWDTAFKDSEISDPSAATVWGIGENGYYLLDVINKRMEFPELKKRFLQLYEVHKATGVLVEDRASGQSLIQDIKMETRIPIIPISTNNVNKILRFDAVTTLFEAGKVFLPEEAHWLSDYEYQITNFPSTEHDDMVDSTSQFLQWVNKPRYVRRPPSKLYWK